MCGKGRSGKYDCFIMNNSDDDELVTLFDIDKQKSLCYAVLIVNV
jgi:hypothetical protein